MTKYLIYIIFPIFFASCADSVKQEVTVKKRPIIPNELNTALQNKFPNLKKADKKEYSKLFWQFYDANFNPVFCTTDINNDQMLDYAFLVKEKNSLKVLVATSFKETFSFWLSPFNLEDITPKGLNFCLDIKPAGRIDVVKKKPVSLVLKKNAFVIKNLEQDQVVIYENEGKIMLFPMTSKDISNE